MARMHVDAGPLRRQSAPGRSVPATSTLPGVGGMIPLIIMAILAYDDLFRTPWFSRFVLSVKRVNITEVVEEHFEAIGAGKRFTLLYFFAIYPILLVLQRGDY